MNKNELMEMALAAGMPFKVLPDDYCDDVGLVRGVICSVDNVRFACIEALFNAILERAAVECETNSVIACDIEEWIGMTKRDISIRAMQESANSIRSLKLPTN